jgi:hypothetical protein
MPWGDTVTFTAQQNGAGVGYALTFVPASVGCASPLQSAGACQVNFGGAYTNTGAAQGAVFTYGSLSINGVACNLNPNGGPGPLGMRMKP